MRTIATFLTLTAMAGSGFAQAPAAQPAAAPAPGPAPATNTASAPAPGGGTPATSSPAENTGQSTLGNDLPFLNPANEILSWDGKNWNINNNRIFEARFEKYLNAPEATTAEDRQYQAIIAEILQRLAPGNATSQNIDYAFRLLPRGSNFDADARLCDALADAVYTVWATQRQQQRLLTANQAMQYEIMSLEAATRHQGTTTQNINQARNNSKPGGGAQSAKASQRGASVPVPTPPTSTNQAAEAKQTAVEGNWQTRRLAEMVSRQKGNDAKRELSEIQAKVEFQALIVQFFFQRRFQHVLMATRFYRSLFSDGDTKLNVGDDTRNVFMRTSGMPPTVATLDALANESIRDVREGVKAFEYLLEREEMASASKRLAEAFSVGEFMPEIRTLPREKKRRALAFSQKSYQLISALEVKDYALAEKLVNELTGVAKDFDASKPLAAVETARTLAGFRLEKARNAALSGDRATLETELRAATEAWPRNPALAEVSKLIFDQGNVQQRALMDFDQLLSQKNFRQIFENSGRFIAASAMYPERAEQLKEVMERMKGVEAALLRAQEMGRQSNFAGAWESVEKAAADAPEDPKLNQARADLTTQAPEFVRSLRRAQELEKQDQLGSALAWYLKAWKLYPASDLAQAGTERIRRKILPQD